MKAQIQIPDDIYDIYSEQAEGMGKLGKSVSPEEIMADRLHRFKNVEPSDRVVVVDPKVRARLEVLLGKGSLLDAEDLLKKVQALADVQIGEIKLAFSATEVAQLHRWSKHGGRPLDQLLNETVEKLKNGIFDYVKS